MRLALGAGSPVELPAEASAAPPVPPTIGPLTPGEALPATLFYKAYHGTTDDEGETVADWQAELAATLAGQYGPLIPAATLLARTPGAAEPLGAVVCTRFRQVPLVTFLAVAPAARRQGLGARLMRQACAALRQQSAAVVYLVVTDQNEAAVRLYQALGFTACGHDWATVLGSWVGPRRSPRTSRVTPVPCGRLASSRWCAIPVDTRRAVP